jgi:hypothetical protein
MTQPLMDTHPIRVFPEYKANWTPTGDDVYYDAPPMWLNDCGTVHVSVTFSWHKPRAEFLAEQWKRVSYDVRIGGPAYDNPGGDFVPGRYLTDGITITSRGCPKTCGMCLVPKREGKIRTLPIKPGRIIQDNNLLACPRGHIEAVFYMLGSQRDIQFSGGLEAERMRPWVADLIRGVRLGQLFLAYDRPSQLKWIRKAVAMLSGIKRRKIRCYVLVGQPGDTPDAAEARLVEAWEVGTLPFSMFYRPPEAKTRTRGKEWSAMMKRWARPAIINKRMNG